jgi:hypothetical protein
MTDSRSGRSSRPGRPAGGGRSSSGGRSSDRGRSSGSDRPRRDDDRGPRRDDDRRPRRDDDRRPRRDDDERRGNSSDRRPRRDDDRRPRRDDDHPDTRTDAQRKSDEVKRRIGERRVKEGPSTPPKQSQERWIDEGPVRGAAKGAVKRGKVDGRGARKPSKPTTSPDRKKARKVANDVQSQFVAAVGPRRATRMAEQFAEATIAFDRDRVDDARRLLLAMGREALSAPCAHELMGLIRYRAREWKKAASELEIALASMPDAVEHIPVLMDCYRALGDHDRVTQLWKILGEESPHPEIMAEGRIVLAGTKADQGDLPAALALMEKSGRKVKPVRDYHLREWYFLADLYDRSGDVINARKYFSWVYENDADFVDVLERLASLGG